MGATGSPWSLGDVRHNPHTSPAVGRQTTRAVSNLAPTGDRPGRNGVTGMAMSAGSGGDAHASASADSYGNPVASSPPINLHCEV